MSKPVTVQHFLNQHRGAKLANKYAHDLSALKSLALASIALDGDETLIDKALEAVGISTDAAQRTTINVGERGEAKPPTSRAINLCEYERLTVRFERLSGDERFRCDLHRDHSELGHQFVFESLSERPAVFTTEGFYLPPARQETDDEILIELTGSGVVTFTGADDAKLLEVSWLEVGSRMTARFDVFGRDGGKIQSAAFFE